MWHSRNMVIGLISSLPFVALHAQAKGTCDLPPLLHQKKDEATIQHLESSWNLAISKGDTKFEGCLLTSDFMEIFPGGELKTRTDQLGFTAKNKGQNKPVPEAPKVAVLIHGNVAVAYAAWKTTGANGQPETTETADYFVWENGLWHVFFSQATPLKDDSH